jgi:hypothetical protein
LVPDPRGYIGADGEFWADAALQQFLEHASIVTTQALQRRIA